MEEKGVFREKSLERIKSPENLNEYIKVANPGMWIGLLAVLAVLLGFVVWGSVASIDTVVYSAVVVSDSKGVCYFPEKRQQYYKQGMTIEIEGQEYVLGKRTSQAKLLNSDNAEDASLLHIMEADGNSEWFDLYEIGGINLEDGIYKGKIIADSIRPISFLFNKEEQ